MSDTNDSFTETTQVSWLSRIGESIKGVLVGLVLIVGSTVLLFWNEGRAVQTARSLAEGAGLVVNADPSRVDSANEAKLVHLSGEAKAATALRDPEFGVSAQALRLVRNVEMYQWKEESKTETRRNLGGSEEKITTYSYPQVWSDSRIDSSRFRRPEGHSNPEMRYRRRAVSARDATLGAFRPGEATLSRLSANDELRVEADQAGPLRGRVAGPVQVLDGRFYLGADPERPRIGDLRIAFQIAPLGPVSIVGRQAGADLTEYQTQAGDRLLMVRSGTASAADMFKAAADENRLLTWILRVIGAVVMFLGFSLILRPLVVVADVVPLLGDILGAGAGLVSLMLTAIFAPLTVAVAWLWYRPLVSIAALAIGGVLAYGFKCLAARKAAGRAAQPAPAR